MPYWYGIIRLLKMYDVNNILVQHPACKLGDHTVLEWNSEVCTCLSVGMEICSEVLVSCVIATEVTQAWYLAMNITFSNLWM
jgi:hypothetical protein